MDSTLDTVDKAVLWTSTGLILTGVVVLGLVELVTGEPYVAAPITNEAGDVIAAPTVDPAIRTGLVMAGVLLLMLYGAYKMAMPDTGATETVAGDR